MASARTGAGGFVLEWVEHFAPWKKVLRNFGVLLVGLAG
jgi:hypothetical protein